MSFVLKLRCGLFIALATLLVVSCDDEEDGGSVKLEIKNIENVAAGTGDNASVSVEVTIKDGDKKVTGDDAKAEVNFKHKCGSADKFSGSDKATAASAVASGSINVPRPAADAEGDTHKCKIQASAKIGDKDLTVESNEFTVGKKDDSASDGNGTKEAKLEFNTAGQTVVYGVPFVVKNSGDAKGTVEIKNCEDVHLFNVSGSVPTESLDVEKMATTATEATFVVLKKDNTLLNNCKFHLGKADTTGTAVAARPNYTTNPITIGENTDSPPLLTITIDGANRANIWAKGDSDWVVAPNDANGSTYTHTLAAGDSDEVLYKENATTWHYNNEE